MITKHREFSLFQLQCQLEKHRSLHLGVFARLVVLVEINRFHEALVGIEELRNSGLEVVLSHIGNHEESFADRAEEIAEVFQVEC